jgi:multidrug resistance protein
MLRGDFFEPLKRERRLAPLLIMIALIMMGNGVVSPILSIYAQTFGVASTLVGTLITIYGIGRLMANLPAGILSQRIGRRPMLFVGPLIVAGSSAAAAMTGDFGWLLFWRLIQGVGSGIYMTASLAAIADISPPAHRVGNMALYQAALQGGAMIGPAFGGYVAAWFGYAAPFWALAVVGLLASLTAVSSFEDTLSKAEAGKPLPSSVSKRGMMTVPFTAVCVLTCVIFFSRVVSLYQLVPQIAAERLHLDVGVIGAALTFCGLVNFVILPVSPWTIEKFGARGVVGGSTFLTVAGLLLLYVADTQTVFWLAILVFGIGGGIAYPAISAFTVGCLPRERYGAGMGMQRTFGDAGFVFGPVIAGALDDLTGSHDADIMLNCVLMTLATLVFLVATAGRRSAVTR